MTAKNIVGHSGIYLYVVVSLSNEFSIVRRFILVKVRRGIALTVNKNGINKLSI